MHRLRNLPLPVFFDEKSMKAAQYSAILQGIRGSAARFGIRLRLINETEADSISEASLPPAVILTGSNMSFMQKTIESLRKLKRHVILAGFDSEQFGHDISCATPSRRTETEQLINYLHAAGKDRIALVGFGSNSLNDSFRYHAVMSASAVWGLPLSESDVWFWQDDPLDAFTPFLQKAQSYDAVICPNDFIAICFIRCAKEAGLSIPKDLFVASFGNSLVGRCFSPSITTVTLNMDLVGEQAFLIWRFLTGNESSLCSAMKITVPSRILARESTDHFEIPEHNHDSPPPRPVDGFYTNPTISPLQTIENCLSLRDEADLHILRNIMDGLSYEQIAELCFVSVSTLRYRVSKIYADAGVKTRLEFESLLRGNLQNENPLKFL